MLNNLMNRHDLDRVRAKLADHELSALVRKLSGSTTDRVVRQWNNTAPQPSQWWSIPAVRRRWNRLVSGSEDIDFPAHVARCHLQGRPGLRALSLGCGLGGRELRWAELGVFEHIDAFDIAPSAVAAARRQAEDRGYGDVITFAVRDFTALQTVDRYDVVIAEHSLHHLAPMPEVVAKIERLLAPSGLFVVDEFVGPRRFQWTDAQVAAAQELLLRFPARYRRVGEDEVRSVILRPSKLWMRLTDPSEAIDSARIQPALRERFDVLEERPYGGAVLHLAFTDISQHFLGDDDETMELLQMAFRFEDELMERGEVPSDFVAAVCRLRGERA